MALPLYVVDAFSDRPFAGNPAAVAVLPTPDALHDALMQAVAAEMNQSETAFVAPLPEPGGPVASAERASARGAPRRTPAAAAWSLRWFTPAAEVELCGHATLAAAHALWETGRAAADQPVRFETRWHGTLTCRRVDARVAMDFPADPPTEADPPAGLLEALRVKPARVATVARSTYDWIVELDDPAAVRDASPDFAALTAVDCRGVSLTAAGGGDGGADVVSRFFAPRLRIAEDPVTGSLHCVLGPWWADRLGKRELDCEQASPRGGRLTVRLRDDDGGTRVDLIGSAVMVVAGELRVPPAA